VLVVDASVAVAACHTPVGFTSLRRHQLVAPQLMIVEASSTLHEGVRRQSNSLATVTLKPGTALLKSSVSWAP
jgi:hypothetical protein